jgi:hypothetical protein
LREAGELVRQQFAVENGDVPLRLLRHLRGDVAHLQGRLEVGARLLVGTKASESTPNSKRTRESAGL